MRLSTLARLVLVFALAAAAAVVLTAGSDQGQGRGAPPATGTGFIAGRVTEANTTRPVPGAMVTLWGGVPSRSIGADEQGRFFFAGLPAGSFQINAMSNGYLLPATQRPVVLGQGERLLDVRLRLARRASITGVIRDDTGDPVVGTGVLAFRRVLVNGRWSRRRAGETRTDDRGVYRLGVDPGDYVVCACVRDAIPFDGLLLTTIASEPLQLMTVAARVLSRGADAAELDTTLRTYQPTFYGGSVESAQAAVVRVASGEEKVAIDITTPAVPAARVSGRVIGAIGAVQATSIGLLPMSEANQGTFGALPAMLVQPDGRFDFAGVPPGNYIIRVMHSPGGDSRNGPSGAALAFVGARAQAIAAGDGQGAVTKWSVQWADVPISIGPAGQTDINVPLREGARVSGRAVFEGSRPSPVNNPLARQTFGVRLEMLNPDPFRPPVALGAFNDDETFTFTGVVPGRYVVAPAIPGFILKSVTRGGADVTDQPIDVGGADVSDLVITFTNAISIGMLEGSVAGATLPLQEDLTALVFPNDRRYWNAPAAARSRFRATPIARNGTWRNPLPAGDYLVVVVDDDAAVDWQEQTRLDLLARTAQRVIMAEGGKTTVTVRR